MYLELEALGQCIPPPRHVLPVSRFGYPSLDPDPSYGSKPRSLIVCSLAHCQPSLKISGKSVHRQTERKTYNLGGGNEAGVVEKPHTRLSVYFPIACYVCGVLLLLADTVITTESRRRYQNIYNDEGSTTNRTNDTIQVGDRILRCIRPYSS